MIKTLYKIFQHWSEYGAVYILSDLHLDDDDCLYMDPNWISPEEQIWIINNKITKDDTFICLGDVGSSGYASQIRAGHKVLLLGNHDRRKDYVGIFDEIYEGPLFISSKILLSHEPVYGLSWCLNIHGHDHSGIEAYAKGCKHLNLAANVCGYTPVSLGKLINSGILSDINSIHRETINRAVDREKWKIQLQKEDLKPVGEECDESACDSGCSFETMDVSSGIRTDRREQCGQDSLSNGYCR